MRTSQATTTNNSALAGPQGMARGGLGSANGPRLPVAPRERKPALAALAVLLILGGALVSAYLVMASGQRVSAIQIAGPVAQGQPVPLSAMREVQIGDTGINYIAWTERFKVTQAYAAVPLVKGTLLTNGMIVSSGDPTAGRVVVGLALKPGQYPAAGLTQGQHVALFVVNGQNSGYKPGTMLAEDAIVSDAGDSRAGQSDVASISVTIPPEQAASVLQAASAGEVGVAVLPNGTHIPREQGQQPTVPAPSKQPQARPTTSTTALRSP